MKIKNHHSPSILKKYKKDTYNTAAVKVFEISAVIQYRPYLNIFLKAILSYVKNTVLPVILSIEKIKNYKKIEVKIIILEYGNLVFKIY
jgi:hypothetical protein